MPVRHAILGLLAQHPRHGYELKAAFEALAGGPENWEVKPAQVYTTLARLSEAGLVSEEAVEKDGGPEKHIYQLTSIGQAELSAWFMEGCLPDHMRDEFYLKLMLALALDDTDVNHMLSRERTLLYQELHRVTTQRQTADPRQELGMILLLDKAVMHLEADLRWLDMVEARLDDMRRQPLPQPEIRPRGRPKKE